MYVIDAIEEKIKNTINNLGYKLEEVNIMPSNRPELGDYQYNGAMALAKVNHKNPMDIANDIVKELENYEEFSCVCVAKPGFINLTFSDKLLLDFMNNSNKDITINYNLNYKKTIFLDYGGPNLAKILHVGHLRSGNIGQALNNLCKVVGCHTISDVHLGDFGRPMGLVILEIKTRYPDLAYFKNDYKGEDVDFTITNDDLLEIYPIASKKAKENSEYMEEARQINLELQQKKIGYYNLWQKIVEASLLYVKNIYNELNVSFDLWEGESDNFEYMEEVLKYLDKDKNFVMSSGAKVIFVNEDGDNIDIPPLIVVKSNGAVSYEATDLAAIWERTHRFKLDEIWYFTDKRQDLRFTQIFRAAHKTKMINDNIKLVFSGFGTMNGKDGKPFKTRDGGVMPLSTLLDMVTDKCLERLSDNVKQNRYETARTIAIAAIKYADLLPNRATDYNFDIDKFTDLNGKTGTYLLYSTIRMKSLLSKADINFSNMLTIPNESVRKIILAMLDLKRIIKRSFLNHSLSEIAEYLYKITNLYNNFYGDNKVISEVNKELKETMLTLTKIIYDNNVYLLNILGINIPEKI